MILLLITLTVHKDFVQDFGIVQKNPQKREEDKKAEPGV